MAHNRPIAFFAFIAAKRIGTRRIISSLRRETALGGRARHAREVQGRPEQPNMPAEDRTCADAHPQCASWAAAGECAKNPAFMHESCKRACALCGAQAGGAARADEDGGAAAAICGSIGSEREALPAGMLLL